MKKVFIGLLIIAAGASVYFLIKTNNKSARPSLHKEFIVGKWNLDSLYKLNDSATEFMTEAIAYLDPQLNDYEYEFNAEGSIKLRLKGSVLKTEMGYDWVGNDQLAWKEYPANTTIEVFEVSVLSKDSMVLRSKDSVALCFAKTK